MGTHLELRLIFNIQRLIYSRQVKKQFLILNVYVINALNVLCKTYKDALMHVFSKLLLQIIKEVS